MIRLACDMDGVLCSFHAAYRSVIHEVTGEARIPEGEIPRCWDYMTQQYGYTEAQDAETWARINADPTFWARLTPLAGAVAFLAQLDTWTNNGPNREVVFVTSRKGVNTKRQTEHWLRRHGKQYPTVILASNKKPVFKALRVTHVLDDKPSHVEAALEVGCRAILRAWPYNAAEQESLVAQGAKVITDLSEFWEVL